MTSGPIGISWRDAVVSRLFGDLCEARRAAVKAEDATEDGGSCNCDSLCLTFPRARHTKAFRDAVETATSNARMSGFWARETNGKGWKFLVLPPVSGQGAKRTAAAEAMAKVMLSHQWIASVDYVVD